MRDFRRFLLRLGCLAPPPMTHIRPMGASVHYAGLLPMSRQPRPLTTSPEGRSHDFDNLYFVDGTTFPALPAKNLTFTLMANAVRIARRAFG
jgi:choline dehydrogenase-like flavoprotein